jgi:hypothetical protein
MLCLMRQLVGTLALVALLASPTVAQVRFFCRYTGIEITDCEEQRVPERDVVQQDGCCERRLSTAPAPVTRTPEPVLPQVAAVALLLAPPLPIQPASAVQRDRVPRSSAGPPLFLQQGALLI